MPIKENPKQAWLMKRFAILFVLNGGCLKIVYMQKLCRAEQFFTIVKFQQVILNETQLKIIL